MNVGRLYEIVDSGVYKIVILGKPKIFVSMSKLRKATFGEASSEIRVLILSCVCCGSSIGG